MLDMDMSSGLRRAALFDLDGVLVDTEPAYTAFWRRVGELYFPYERGFAERLKGHTLTDIFARYFPHDAAGRQGVERMLRELEQTMDYPLMDGCMEVVARLRSEGWKTAVVTSSDRAKMAHLYRVHPLLPSLFDAVITAEDVKNSKPAPEGYLLAAERLGCLAEDCVVFEDSLSGLQAARASGAWVVGLTTSLSGELIAPLADWVIDGWADLSPSSLCRELRLGCSKGASGTAGI